MAGLAFIFSPECPDGTYGSNCSQQCGQGCDPPDSCNKTNGECVCLSANWETVRCSRKFIYGMSRSIDAIIVLSVVANLDLTMGL